MALLYDAGVRGNALDAVQAWKEVLLAVAVARVASEAVRVRRLPFAPMVVDWLALAFAAIVCLYALIPQDLLDGEAGGKAVLYGLRHGLVPVVAYFLGRSLVLTRTDLRRLGWTLLGGGRRARRWRADRPLCGRRRMVARVRRRRATSATSSASTTTARAACPTTGRSTPRTGCTAGSCRASSARLRPRSCSSSRCSCRGVALAGTAPPAARRRAARDLRGRPPLHALALVARRARRGPSSCSRSPRAVGGRSRRPRSCSQPASAYAYAFTSVAPRTHFFPADLPYQQEQARQHGALPGGGSLALNPGEPSLRSHWRNLRDGIDTVFTIPRATGSATPVRRRRASASRSAPGSRTTRRPASRRDCSARSCSSPGALRCSTRSCARPGRRRTAPTRWAAAGGAAALAAILALAIQTDAYGVPWLAYCLWWLAGSLVEPAAVPFVEWSRSSTPAYASATST